MSAYAGSEFKLEPLDEAVGISLGCRLLELSNRYIDLTNRGGFAAVAMDYDCGSKTRGNGAFECWIHVAKLLRAHGGCLGVRRL